MNDAAGGNGARKLGRFVSLIRDIAEIDKKRIAVKNVLEQTPPELASDIIDKGIVMSGGTSLLRNFSRLMTQETGVPSHVAEDALYCVVKGTGIALDHLDAYKKAIITKR